MAEFQSNLLASGCKKLFDQPPDRDRFSAANIYNSATLRVLGEGDQINGCLFNREIISQLLASRHWEFFIAALQSLLQLTKQATRILSRPKNVKQTCPLE